MATAPLTIRGYTRSLMPTENVSLPCCGSDRAWLGIAVGYADARMFRLVDEA
jgi:hypothetical protein